jgi:hypothetical protein
MNEDINENWECFLCTKENKFETLPTGYLSNWHPLCQTCADIVLNEERHMHRFRLTYHNKIGDIKLLANIPVHDGYTTLN